MKVGDIVRVWNEDGVVKDIFPRPKTSKWPKGVKTVVTVSLERPGLKDFCSSFDIRQVITKRSV